MRDLKGPTKVAEHIQKLIEKIDAKMPLDSALYRCPTCKDTRWKTRTTDAGLEYGEPCPDCEAGEELRSAKEKTDSIDRMKKADSDRRKRNRENIWFAKDPDEEEPPF